MALGGDIRLGFSQEIGYDGHITSEGRSTSDVYSKTAFRIGLSHPVMAFDNKLVFNPILGLSFLKYRELSELDTVGLDLSGPLTLQLEGVGDESDSLRLSADMKRDTGAVSVGNTQQALRTDLRFRGLYTRHWRSPRWKSEFGYQYLQRLYDDVALQDRDSTTHTLSAALLYGLNRAVNVGLRTSYAMEAFSGGQYLDSDTLGIESLVRWQMTGKVESELAIGREMVSYEDGGSDAGITLRGALDYQVTPRWQCLATVRRGFDAADSPNEPANTTTSGNVTVAYRFTPTLTGKVTPGMRSQTGDAEITERTCVVGATYAFRLFDLTLQTGVTDRTSDRGGDDTYTAMDAALRVDVDF